MFDYVDFLLRDLNQDINQRNRHGLTALHFAVQAQDENLVRYLIKNGAKMDARGKDGRIPLDMGDGLPVDETKEAIDTMLWSTYMKRRLLNNAKSAGVYGHSMFEGHEDKVVENYGIKDKDVSLRSMEETTLSWENVRRHRKATFESET